jgi:hypothetical protein
LFTSVALLTCVESNTATSVLLAQGLRSPLLCVVGVAVLSSPGHPQPRDPGDGGKAYYVGRRAILAGANVPTTILEIRQRLTEEQRA